ncbi:hypothetical protein DICPUDRAFT_91776, partial [Dictyostelium purpureum]
MSPYADSQDPGGSGTVVNSSTENIVDNVIVVNASNNVKTNILSPSSNNNNSNNNSSTTPPPPATATNAAGVIFNSNNSNGNNGTILVNGSSGGINIMNNSGNSITINGSGSGSIPSPSGNGMNSSTNGISGGVNYSLPLADIDQYLMAFPTDLPELVVAACWWAESLGKLNMNIPKDNIKRFRKELLTGLRNRINGHWYPDYPERGQGYRAVICEETTDRL